jgi:uncharacterized surface protein with fasciclin (FAS1) repeats
MNLLRKIQMLVHPAEQPFRIEDEQINQRSSHKMESNMRISLNRISGIGFALGIGVSAVALASAMPMAGGMGNPTVGGHAMMRNENIVQNAVNSPDNTTLVAAVKQAGLVSALETKGPFTVFAPTNNAFAAVPKATLDSLMQNTNKKQLAAILEYHVVSGTYTMQRLEQLIRRGGGTAKLKTLNGHDLMFKMNGAANIVVIDDHGDIANISTYNVMQSNGVIQVINKVLLP